MVSRIRVAQIKPDSLCTLLALKLDSLCTLLEKFTVRFWVFRVPPPWGICMIFHMGGKVERESRFRKTQPGTKSSALERAAHEADCLELLSRRQAVGQRIEQVANKAKTLIQTTGFASLDFATCIQDTIHMLTSRSLDQYQHAGPPPLKRVPRALTITMDFLQYR